MSKDKKNPPKPFSVSRRPAEQLGTVEVARSDVEGMLTVPYRSSGLSVRETAIERLKLEEAYREAIETLEVFELLKGQKAPDFERVLQTFTDEMLLAAQEFQESKLIITAKDSSFKDLITAIDEHKMIEGQQDCCFGKVIPPFTKKSKNFEAYICDAAQIMQVYDFDDNRLSVSERLDLLEEFKDERGLQGMDCLKYAYYAMQMLKNGLPPGKYATLFEEDGRLRGNNIAHGSWHKGGRRLDFFAVPDEWMGEGYRFRLSVGGTVPNVRQ